MLYCFGLDAIGRFPHDFPPPPEALLDCRYDLENGWQK
jgi:hypothetical protein